MKYKVENVVTEQQSEHRTWGAAFNAARKLGNPGQIRIIERDQDGEREYNIEGKILSRDGHYE